MDVAQTCMGTLMGGGEKLIRFGDIDLISRSLSHFEMSKYGFRALSSGLVNGF